MRNLHGTIDLKHLSHKKAEKILNSLLRAKKYADGTRHAWHYNRQAQAVRYADASGNVHHYDFDHAGRLLHDRVDTLAAGIDDAIRRISYLHDSHGRLNQVASWSHQTVGRGAMRNQAVFDYDPFGNLSHDWQSHHGQTTAQTPKVGYESADAAHNHTRRTALIYPNARRLAYQYGTPGLDHDKLCRPTALQLPNEPTPAVTYDYLGLAQVIQTTYPQPAVTQNHFQLGQTGDAGDIYTSLDRLGRIEEIRWDTATTVLERVLYGYDRAGNRTWRDVTTPGIIGWDEKYAYDGLYQVTQRQRGDLNTARTAIGGTPMREEQFAYDPAGNWLAYTTKASGALTLDQRRAHNDLNQITAPSTANTPWDPETTPLASDKIQHDANGNQLLLPHGADGDWGKSMKLTWDAWNRLVKVANATDSTEIATYQYDGLWRRTVKQTASETRHYYYNDQWRSIEEHIEKADQTHSLEQQHLWGPHHRWQYHRRDRDTNPADATHALSETHYALKDAMSITAIVDTTGAVKERYQYSAFGQRLCVSPTGTGSTESAFAWMLGFHVEFVDASGAEKADTGLVNYGYRYYDDDCGRWLGRDRIGERGGLNLTAFVANSSIAYDFLGLEIKIVPNQKAYDDLARQSPVPYRPDERRLEANRKAKADLEKTTAKLDKSLDNLKKCCEDKPAVLGSLGVCKAINEGNNEINPSPREDISPEGHDGKVSWPLPKGGKPNSPHYQYMGVDGLKHNQGTETSLAHEFEHAYTEGGRDRTSPAHDKENFSNKAEENAVRAENLIRRECPCAKSTERKSYSF